MTGQRNWSNSALLAAAPSDPQSGTDSDSGSLQEATANNSQADVRHELVVIDPDVIRYQSLIDGLRHDDAVIDVVLLDPSQDGIEQISSVLAGKNELDAVHFLSHGSAGSIKLGRVWLTSDNVSIYAGLISGWADALKVDADLLFYGCDVAGSADGQTFIESLAGLTGADVAASVDGTGHSQFDSDWELEWATGSIETPVAISAAAQEGWVGNLDAPNQPPVNTVPSPQTTDEDTSLVFSSANGNAISVNDADAGGNPVEITLKVTNGTTTLSGTTGLTFTAGDGVSDATMTFRGDEADINAALNGLTFSPTIDYSGSATLTLRTLDSMLVTLNLDAALKGRYTFDNTGLLGQDTSPAGATTAPSRTRLPRWTPHVATS